MFFVLISRKGNDVKYIYIFYIFFLFSFNSKIYKKNSQNGVVSAPITTSANRALMEYYIDKN